MTEPVTNPLAEDVVETAEQQLAFTQNIRRRAANHLLRNGRNPEGDELDKLLKIVDGMDRQVLTLKRINADQASAGALAQHTALVSEALSQIGRKDPYRFKRGEGEVVDVSTIPQLGDEVPRPEMVPGETDINPPTMDIVEFNKKFENQPPASP